MKLSAAIAFTFFVSLGEAFSPCNFKAGIPVSPFFASSQYTSSTSQLFCPAPSAGPSCPYSQVPNRHTQLSYSNGNPADSNYLLDEFRTADGEIINPYRILKVGRHADRKEIRKSYRALSKKYHPDGARFAEVLPGNCNDQDDIRSQWERVKLSYEILSDRKRRLKYDRHSALNDPRAAFGRMAVDTIGWGMTSLAKGIFHIGDLAAKSVRENRNGGDKIVDNDSSESTSTSKSSATLRANRSSQQSNGTFQYSPERNMAMKGNSMSYALPAPTNQDFWIHLEMIRRLQTFLKSESVLEAKDITLKVVCLALTMIGKNILVFGESASNHAAMM